MVNATVVAVLGIFLSSLVFFTISGGDTFFEYSGDKSDFQEPPSADQNNFIDKALSYGEYLADIFTGSSSGYLAFNFIVGGTLSLIAIYIIIAIIRGL